MHVHVCKVHRFLYVSTIFLLDLGNVPTMCYFFFMFFWFVSFCLCTGKIPPEFEALQLCSPFCSIVRVPNAFSASTVRSSKSRLNFLYINIVSDAINAVNFLDSCSVKPLCKGFCVGDVFLIVL